VGALVENYARKDQQVEYPSPQDSPTTDQTHEAGHGVGTSGIEDEQFQSK
jgi:hypothetical protein